jgi:NADH:ubiquinone oxidoreductase subunit 5 (subunit L)/multisubunit Na+/H+ antiporter MnhA subunit
MPLTWIAFLVGSIAIVGLPPLNGFVSEWVVFQSLFRGGLSGTPVALSVFGAAALGLIGGLALACFAKVCGTVFLGHARTPAAAAAVEVHAAAWGPMLALAVACGLLGVFPWIVVPAAVRVVGVISGIPADLIGDLTTPALGGAARISGLAALLFGLTALVAFARSTARRRSAPVLGETWACGYATPTARMQYSASSFAAPLIEVFGPAAGVTVERTAGAFATHPANLVLDRLLEPAWRAVRRAGARLRPIQQGRLQVYLLYIVATVSVLLLYLAMFGGPR